MTRPIALLCARGAGEIEHHAFFVHVGAGFPISACSKSMTTSSARPTETAAANPRTVNREAATHVISRPRIVPVDEANLSSSIPMRWSIETNRFGSG